LRKNSKKHDKLILTNYYQFGLKSFIRGINELYFTESEELIVCADTLLKDIEICRKEMVELAAKTSLSNQRVVDISAKLDHLLNKYYHLTSKKTFLY
jgi:hypothetical protein